MAAVFKKLARAFSWKRLFNVDNPNPLAIALVAIVLALLIDMIVTVLRWEYLL